MHRLGVWPDLAAPDRRTSSSTLSRRQTGPCKCRRRRWWRRRTGRLLLAGYRTVRGGGFVGGGVSLFDTARPSAGTRWLAAPGVEAALGLGSYFLVGADGLGEAGDARGVYAANVDDTTLRPGLVATYPTTRQNVRPGLVALTANGVVAIGHYLDLARHSVRLPEPSLLTVALSGGPAVRPGGSAGADPGG